MTDDYDPTLDSLMSWEVCINAMRERYIVGKRTDYPKIEKDFYRTPAHAVEPLLAHLNRDTLFDEPCCGDGALVRHLQAAGHHCNFASDIDPKMDTAPIINAMDRDDCKGEMFITNPPYTWKVLDPMITHLSGMAPTWLLLPADMMHNKRMAPHIKRCRIIQSVGRVKWFDDKSGMENSAWYLFTHSDHGHTKFYGRQQ